LNTQDEFVNRVSQTLAHTLVNDWEYLERQARTDMDMKAPPSTTSESLDQPPNGKPEAAKEPGEAPLATRQKRVSRVVTSLRWTLVTAVTAFLPLAILFGASEANLLPEANTQYGTVGILLALVGVLSRVDPIFKDKLQIASAMMGQK
jgi:hypothetical protein